MTRNSREKQVTGGLPSTADAGKVGASNEGGAADARRRTVQGRAGPPARPVGRLCRTRRGARRRDRDQPAGRDARGRDRHQSDRRLDAPVDRLLTELDDRKVLKRLDGPLEDTVPANRAITVRDLLTFRMGFGQPPGPPGARPIEQAVAEQELMTLGPP